MFLSLIIGAVVFLLLWFVAMWAMNITEDRHRQKQFATATMNEAMAKVKKERDWLECKNLERDIKQLERNTK